MPPNERPEETHTWIKAELRRRGSSMAQFSRDIGVTQGSVSLVSQGLHRSKRIEQALATALSITPQQLFPDRYPDQDVTANKLGASVEQTQHSQNEEDHT